MEPQICGRKDMKTLYDSSKSKVLKLVEMKNIKNFTNGSDFYLVTNLILHRLQLQCFAIHGTTKLSPVL